MRDTVQCAAGVGGEEEEGSRWGAGQISYQSRGVAVDTCTSILNWEYTVDKNRLDLAIQKNVHTLDLNVQ